MGDRQLGVLGSSLFLLIGMGGLLSRACREVILLPQLQVRELAGVNMGVCM